VVVTGGEPTIHKDLADLLENIRGLNVKIKLDTNGNNPDIVSRLLGRGLLDFCAMDVKAGLRSYDKAAGVKVDISRIRRSIELLNESGIQCEFRTPCVPEIIEEDDIRQIGEMLKGVKAWHLHQFRGVSTLDASFGKITPHSKQTMERFAEIAKEYAQRVDLRGMNP